MLDARYVADHLDEVRTQLARRGSEFAQALDGVASLVVSRRELTRKTELLQGERNQASDAMAKLAKSGDKVSNRFARVGGVTVEQPDPFEVMPRLDDVAAGSGQRPEVGFEVLEQGARLVDEAIE